MKPLYLALFLFLCPPGPAAADRIIFGEDDRVEYYQIPEPFKSAADSVVSLWPAAALKAGPEGDTLHFSTRSFGQVYRLCPGERFSAQPAGAFCSGSLVGEDLVLTAGHCIEDQAKCAKTAFVFGYAVKAPGRYTQSSVPAADVYGCTEILKRDWTNYTVTQNGEQSPTIYGDDFALIRLDRKVAGRRPLAVNRAGDIKKGDAVTAMGYPNGLPLKFSAEGMVVRPVRANSPYFDANLDIFGGNSGGPAFNAATGLIEGVVVRADADHFLTTFEGCRVYHVKPQNAGAGISINKLGPVLDLIPPTPAEAAAARKAQRLLEDAAADPGTPVPAPGF